MLTSKITRLEPRTVTWGILFVAAVGWMPISWVPLGAAEPELRLIHPEKRTIPRGTIGEASFVEAYQRTSIYAKVDGYIEKWNVDIGDQVKKGDVLATLKAPELNEEWETKKAKVKLAEGRVKLSHRALEVKQAEVKTAEARVTAAKAMLKASAPAREEAAEAVVAVAEAELLEKKAAVAQAKDAIEVARAEHTVAISEARRLEAWVGYLRLLAPYDGVIVERNVNTWDLVSPPQSAAADRTRTVASRPVEPPAFVIARTDIVRVFVTIPEEAAPFVRLGTKAMVRIPSYQDKPISAAVTFTSWVLDPKFRNLRAEIDLRNPKGEIMPGMYAYGVVVIPSPREVWTLPSSALDESKNKLVYWEYKNGRALRRQVQTGSRDSDGKWIEITKRLSPASKGDSRWVPIDGSEKVIVGDLSQLADGKAVTIPDAPSSP